MSAPDTGRPEKFYLPFVDGLRAISILLVLGFHQLGPISGWFGKQLNGWIGVDLFFVISGFLITSIILQEQRLTGSFSVKNFYARRWLRIFPAYYFFLAVMLGFGLLRGISVVPFGIAALYLTNFDVAFALGKVTALSGVIHTWSLSIEEQFYLTFAPCAAFLKRHLIWLAVAVIVGVYFWRLMLALHGATPLRLLGGFDTKIDSIMYGVLAAHLCQYRLYERGAARLMGNRVVQLLLVAAMLASFHFLGHPGEPGAGSVEFYWSFKYPITLMLMMLVIISLTASPATLLGRFLSTTPMVWIGRLSYSLYLWHVLPMFPTNYLMIYHFCHGRRYLVELMMFAVCFGLAYGSYRCIEQPFLRLKRRFSAVETAR